MYFFDWRDTIKGTPKRMQDKLSNVVYDIRKERGVTQEGLAKAIDVTRQTIIAIEKGNYTPSVLLALKIARYFNKSVEEIFQYTNHRVEPTHS